MRCPNTDREQCTHPKCGCFKTAEDIAGSRMGKTLGDYIQRVVEAEKGLPVVRRVDVAPVHFVMDVLYKRKETLYLADLLKKVLDNAKDL